MWYEGKTPKELQDIYWWTQDEIKAVNDSIDPDDHNELCYGDGAKYLGELWDDINDIESYYKELTGKDVATDTGPERNL